MRKKIGFAASVAPMGGLVFTLISATTMLMPPKAQTWAQASPANSPSQRQFHAMAYDTAHGQVVLFGGFNISGYLGDTWVWVGTNWTQKSPSTSPTARDLSAMAYDSLHGQVVLFGGLFGNGSYLSDTWLWEGGFSVSPNTGSGTGPQVFAATYFDTNGASDLQVVYLYFGSVGDAPHNCKVAYAQAGNALFLFNDANNGVVSGSLTLGGGGSLSNSQCTLFGGSTAAAPFGAQTYDGTQSAIANLGSWTP
jgi:hypothetical protein